MDFLEEARKAHARIKTWPLWKRRYATEYMGVKDVLSLVEQIEILQEKYPNYAVEAPHFVEAREGSACGEIGNLAYWRVWCFRKRRAEQHSRFSVFAHGLSQDACVEMMKTELEKKEREFQTEG